jgi:peptidoglycan/LPS O-acetylase OafA/YrhL
MGHCWYFGYPAFNSTQPIFPPIAFAHKAVPMFAALSGFLIYRSVLAINSIDSLREYAWRRFFRIYPVYAFGILVALCFGQYAAHKATTSPVSFFVSDLFMLRMFWAPIFANPVTWSLYVEAVFYIVLPIAVLTAGRQRFPWIAGAALIAFLIADFPGRDHAIWMYFLIGILASEAAGRIGKWSAPMFIVGAVMLAFDITGKRCDWGAALRPTHSGMSLGLDLSMFLILASLPNLRSVGAALNVLPLRILGVVSYSLFLMHPFYILANFPQIGMFGGPPKQPLPGVATMAAWYLPLIFLPGVLIWAVACFLLIEQPGIRLGRTLLRSRRTPAGATPSVILAAGGGRPG